jgi:hypothetical protein
VSAPLDATSDRRSLVGRDRPPREHGIDRRPDIGSRHRQIVTRAGVVELAPVDEVALAVEDERVGRAGRGISPGDVLGFVIQVGKRPALAARFGCHLIGSVLRVGDHVIAGDGDHCDALIGEIAAEGGEPRRDVLDVRAVVANEGNDQRGTRKVVETDRGTRRRVGQREVRRRCSQREHGGLNGHIRQTRLERCIYRAGRGEASSPL